MTDNTQQDSITPVSTDAVQADTAQPTYERGTWQATLHRSAVLKSKSEGDKKRATVLLWDGAKAAIDGWDRSIDAGAEMLAAEAKAALGGESRKGDASKIKTVALAVKNNGLDLNGVNPKGKPFVNLSMAYAEAVRLTQTLATEASEDEAAEKALESIEAPNSTTTVEGAALILLSKGLDGLVVAVLDALGPNNEAAHRALLRAFSTEIAARVQAAKPKAQPKAGPKAGATQAAAGAQPKAQAKPVQSGATKAKPVAAGAKAKPVQAAAAKAQAAQPTKAKPVRRPARAK